MTNKQKRFADEYLIDCNAARASKIAYPGIKKDETARANGSRLLTNANVSKYITEQLKSIENSKIAEAKERRVFYTTIMRDDTEKTSDRLKAAETLDKLDGSFTEKLNITADVPIVISGSGSLED